MKELLIGLAVLGLFAFAYFVVDRLGGFLEAVAAQNAEEESAEESAEESPQDAELADDPEFRYQI